MLVLLVLYVQYVANACLALAALSPRSCITAMLIADGDTSQTKLFASGVSTGLHSGREGGGGYLWVDYAAHAANFTV